MNFGRFTCKWLCPLGLLQSLVNFVFHPKSAVRRVCTRLPVSRGQWAVRGTILVVCIGLIAAGFGGPGWFLNPISLVGKTVVGFLPGVIVVAAVLLLAAFTRGRFWCNWICPCGTVFHLLSKVLPGKDKITLPRCNGCKACFASAAHAERSPYQGEESCSGRARRPAELAAHAERSPYQGEESCSGRARRPAEPQPDGVTRRDTLKGVAVLAAAETLEKTTDGGYAPVSLPGVPKRPAPVLPPGARSLGEFTRRCIGCNLCVAACPGKCLTASVSFARFGQPEMDFRHGYCLTGCATDCAKICPTGALQVHDFVERKNLHMGHAIWKKDLCIRTTNGEPCTACVRKCPVRAIHLVEGFPVVDKAKCIGCGACEHVCPARPMPAIFVKGFERQRIVRPMDGLALLAEMKASLANGAACVVAQDGVIAGEATGRGVKPLMKLLDEGKLDRALVVDKVIGRAAAAICVVGGARRVHALLAGADALAFLKKHGVEASADKTVPKILNRDRSGGCPMDRAVDGLDDPKKMVEALKVKAGG